MDKLKILIVEDEDSLGETLLEYLKDKGFACQRAENVENAKKIFFSFSPNVILMDIGLPDGDGISLAKEFRQKNKDFVLLFLSAFNDPQTRFEGLNLGAEDYITKPFDLRELQIRLERILKSHIDLKSYNDLSFGALKVWFKKYEVQDANGNIIPLSQKECLILEMLYKNKGEVVSRDQLIENIWGEDSFPSNRTIDNYIVRLRKWIDTDKTHPLSINSVRGIGYKLETKEVK